MSSDKLKTYGFEEEDEIRALLVGRKAVRIRIRDNCKGFNQLDYLNKLDDEDITHNIGIRLVSKTARIFHYQSTFKLNILTIIK